MATCYICEARVKKGERLCGVCMGNFARHFPQMVEERPILKINKKVVKKKGRMEAK